MQDITTLGLGKRLNTEKTVLSSVSLNKSIDRNSPLKSMSDLLSLIQYWVNGLKEDFVEHATLGHMLSEYYRSHKSQKVSF